jgi:hypothetical protein
MTVWKGTQSRVISLRTHDGKSTSVENAIDPHSLHHWEGASVSSRIDSGVCGTALEARTELTESTTNFLPSTTSLSACLDAVRVARAWARVAHL